jgi:hypothetical protein
MGDLYVDIDSIKKRNGLVYYWMLRDYLEPIKISVGYVNSAISKYKDDCVEEKHTRLNLTSYSQSMGKGRIIYEDTSNESLYPKPNSAGYAVMKFACDNAK